MGISVTKLLIVLAIIMVIFGTKRLRNVGSDLGEAIRNFRSAVKEGEGDKPSEDKDEVIEGEITTKNDEKV
ncbi:MAG: Sec-independent protein translocase subunit TatA [Methylococcaceae bacterium]